MLISLQWLRVPKRILFKIAVMTYRALNGSTPVYLSSYFTRVTDVPSRQRLRSASSNQLAVPPFNLSTEYISLSLVISRLNLSICSVLHCGPCTRYFLLFISLTKMQMMIIIMENFSCWYCWLISLVLYMYMHDFTWNRPRKTIESRAIAGRTALWSCKFQYVSNFYSASA